MNTRVILSINLLILALILVVLPKNQAKSEHLSPKEQLALITENSKLISVDKAAQYLNNQAPDVQFIDIRSEEAYLTSNIPGSINISYADLLRKEWQGYLKQEGKTVILYGSDNKKSSLAQALCTSLGYSNIYTLDGGLDEWTNMIMNSEFKSENLSARENALYGNRLKARRLYTEINSLPDSLKNTFLEAKLLAEEELDGGCE